MLLIRERTQVSSRDLEEHLGMTWTVGFRVVWMASFLGNLGIGVLSEYWTKAWCVIKKQSV